MKTLSYANKFYPVETVAFRGQDKGARQNYLCKFILTF
jgi:hypothetical protein